MDLIKSLCKLSDDQNVYGASDGTIIAYSGGQPCRYRFDDGVWTVQPETGMTDE